MVGLLFLTLSPQFLISFKPPVSPDAVKSLLLTAAASSSYHLPSSFSSSNSSSSCSSIVFAPSPSDHVPSTNSFCINCGFDYCSLCQLLPSSSNACPSPSSSHEFFPPHPFTFSSAYHQNRTDSSPANSVSHVDSSPRPCKNCGNKGTHVLPPQDLKLMLGNFSKVSLPEGGVFQVKMNLKFFFLNFLIFFFLRNTFNQFTMLAMYSKVPSVFSSQKAMIKKKLN